MELINEPSKYEKHKEKIRALKLEYTKLNGRDENIHKSRSIKEIQAAIDKQKIINKEDEVEKSSKKLKAPISLDTTGESSSTSKKLDILHKTITKHIEDVL